MWDHKMSESIIGAGEQIALQQCKINLIQLFLARAVRNKLRFQSCPMQHCFYGPVNRDRTLGTRLASISFRCISRPHGDVCICEHWSKTGLYFKLLWVGKNKKAAVQENSTMAPKLSLKTFSK